MTTFHIITIFPEMFDSYFNDSILKRAIKNGKIKIKFYNPRDFTKNKHRQVDDIPYGGGPGMIMKAEPILRAFKKAKGRKKKVKTIIFSPQGKEFTNRKAKLLQKNYKDIILILGRYEGLDARIKKITKGEELSVGPYILTGGELPAMILIDAVSRQIKGVLGNIESVEEKRESSRDIYTRPEVISHNGKKYKVPKVLLSGHHKNILEWKKKNG
jgi:tRNA (guanine37-N1)-methyltransferase